MNLARFPRRRYTAQVTPLQALPRLSQWLAGPEIWLKRDDLTGLAGGGNKTRKLEFLVADALEQGADTLITAGAVQSNHCRLTAAAAAREGLSCHLVLQELVPGSYADDASGNNFLYRLLGAERTVIGAHEDRPAAMRALAEDLRQQGRTPYVIPTGGSNALGALGYVACARELLQQAYELGLGIDRVVCPSSSGGTHAGLVVGLQDSGVPVTGVVVEHAPDQVAMVHELASRTAERLGVPAPPETAVQVLEGHVGEGYSLPTEGMREAVQQMARLEGILLDPVYTGKTVAGLIDQIRSGAFSAGDHVVLLHTGGSPALFHYRRDVL